MKIYLNSNKSLVIEDGDNVRIIPSGTRDGIFRYGNDRFHLPNLISTKRATEIQRENGTYYEDIGAIREELKDFFANATGDGGLTEEQSEVLKHLSLIDGNIVSDTGFFATSLDSNPGSLNLGNIKLESANHAIGYHNYINEFQAFLTVQGYDNTGHSRPIFYSVGTSSTETTQPLFADNQPSDTESFLTNTGSETILIHGYVIRPSAAGNLRVEVRINDENGRRITVIDNIEVKDSDIGTEMTINLPNHFILESGHTFHTSITGTARLYGTIDDDGNWTPFLKRMRQSVVYDEIYSSKEVDKLVSNPDFVARHSSSDNIVYGAFVDTKVIRRRNLSTGSDTFFTSNNSFTNESDWTHWQNREGLTYAS